MERASRCFHFVFSLVGSCKMRRRRSAMIDQYINTMLLVMLKPMLRY